MRPSRLLQSALLLLFPLFYTHACDQTPDWVCVSPEPESSIAHPQDPFKERVCLVDCEASLQQKSFKYTDEKPKLFDTGHKDVIKVGSFIIDERIRLGYGETASVFLAHQPTTDLLFAVKCTYDTSAEEFKETGDYVCLRKLNRLYGVYQKTLTPNNICFITVTPFGGLYDVNSAPPLFKNQTLSEQIKMRQQLVDALLAELSFLASRGVWHLDQQTFHYLSGWHHKHVLAIDFSSGYFQASNQPETSIAEDEYDVTYTHQGIIHRLILGGFHEKGWKGCIDTQISLSEDLRTGLDQFRQFFKNDAGVKSVSLTEAKRVWEETKKTLNLLKDTKE